MRMNNRERYLNTLKFRPADKIPLQPGHPRESTLKRWRAEGLPEGADWFRFVMETLGIDYEYPREPANHHVNTRMIPVFEEKVLEHSNGHYIVQDWMGAVTEISDRYDYTYIRNAVDFVTRKWHRFPVQTREDWLEMKKRYDARAPERYPENMGALKAEMAGRDYISQLSINGPFWQMREWLGFEGLCIAFMDEPGLVAEMADFWRGFGLAVIETAAAQIPIDSIFISEDMAFKAHPMISPALAREYLLPVYIDWIKAARKHGVQLIDMDSDGYIDDLIPLWIEAGFDVCDPIEVAAHNDIALYRRKYGESIAYTGGIDKRAIAAGGEVMRAEVMRVTAPFLGGGGLGGSSLGGSGLGGGSLGSNNLGGSSLGGGLIPGCDHGVPHDISLPNYIEYVRLLAQLTGWL